ncbi:S1 RNA-binding domain-containing protein [Pseudonocardia bannensis]|uniref:S1 RNA-binding domain-containing protein n=1 Tax=Pseudonocardia bannensis TaxID=630973 RepID=A0A848DRI7_9PSEU|nr:S1 RNA-binding domain-containing protein [Pseudonocardia bannensis]NMH95123.1 S1 RNA-binding domain-containing protein [Pseudonocardia bannensis]
MNTPQHMTPEPAWQEFLVRQCSRTLIEGVVTSVVPFGAFVNLHEGVEGLLHRSEWSTEPQLGASVSVRILQLDLANRRVSLAPA